MSPVAPGSEAPDFALRDQHGATVTLSEFRGRAPVVVVFYPWAFSRVCSGELAELRDRWPSLGHPEAQLLAVSCDAVFALRAYAESDRIDFPLLSDFWPHGEVARAYGVFDDVLGAARRSTFIVDRLGKVHWSVHNERGQARDVSAYVSVLDGLSK